MGSELALLNSALESVPSVVGSHEEFSSYTRPKFLPRIQFYSKGNEKIAPGHWGIPLAAGKVVDLGAQIDVLPIARRMKAMDFTDDQHTIATCDVASEDYKRIKAAKDKNTQGFAFGPSFLVVERSTGQLYELFCGSNPLAGAGEPLIGYCTLTKDDCVRLGHDPSEAHEARPASLSSHKVESKKYKGSWWFVADCTQCSLPFTKLPSVDAIVAEKGRFTTIAPGVESVPADEAPTRAY